MIQFFNLPFSGYHSLIQHGFFARTGGVSTGVFSSLNCGKGKPEEENNIKENRRLAMKALKRPADSLLIADQVHGKTVLTADCVPVLFLDPIQRVVAVAHAGWRGALAGVLDATILKMQELGAFLQTIYAGIGPCIAQESYEVGDELYKAFREIEKESECFFKKQGEKYLFDLSGYVQHRLRKLGVEHVESLGMDTYKNPDLFFSCRRAAHKGEKGFGNGLSAISLRVLAEDKI